MHYIVRYTCSWFTDDPNNDLRTKGLSPQIRDLVENTFWESVSSAQRPLISVPKQEKWQWDDKALSREQFKLTLKGCHYHGPDGKEMSIVANDDVIEKFIDGLKPGLNFTDKFSANVDCCDLIIYCLTNID